MTIYCGYKGNVDLPNKPGEKIACPVCGASIVLIKGTKAAVFIALHKRPPRQQ